MANTVKPVVFDTTTGLTRNLKTGESLGALQFTNNNGSAITRGYAVYVTAADGKIKLALADGAVAGTAKVVGLVYDTTIADQAVGGVVYTDQLTNTTAAWDAITGDTGGLTIGATYFLSDVTAGKITKTCPTTTGHFATVIGVALSATILDLNIHDPFEL